jgi:hypothetical protein
MKGRRGEWRRFFTTVAALRSSLRPRLSHDTHDEPQKLLLRHPAWRQRASWHQHQSE